AAAAAADPAQEPPTAVPNTSSPGRKFSTSPPTASTRPATSDPTPACFGLRNPLSKRAKYGPVTPYHSSGLTDGASTRTSTGALWGAVFSPPRKSRPWGLP